MSLYYSNLEKFFVAAYERVIPRLQVLLQREFDFGAGFLWTVIGFGGGAACYFVLPNEPRLVTLLILAICLVGAALYCRNIGYSSRCLVFITAIVCGVAMAKFEAIRVSPFRLDDECTAKITGWVTHLQTISRNRVRLVVRVKDLGSSKYADRFKAASNRHLSVTVTTFRKFVDKLVVGDAISFIGRFRPVAGPTHPWGYDFSRRAWFYGIGASGFMLGKPTTIDIGPPPFKTRIMIPITKLRAEIAYKIFEALPSVSGTVAAALMIGEYSSVPELVNDIMRVSGIYHIVSISGLHMSMVSGIVLILLRFLFSLNYWFVETYDTKKVAAFFAFICSSFYLLLSGAAVATVRSWIMLSVALFAVLIGRPAVTMHTVTVACGLILLFSPSSVTDPSFLMSFMSVFGLVSAFTWWQGNRGSSQLMRELSWLSFLFIWLRNCIVGSVVASMVAGIATAPIVIDTFYRVSTYSVVTNILVLPVVGLVIMPMGLVAMLLMPFSLEWFPLQFMGYGIDSMINIASWVTSFPYSQGLVGAIHPLAKPIAIIGLLWIMLWRTELRWIGIVPVIISFCLAPFAMKADIMISADGKTISVRDTNGEQRILSANKNRFVVNAWLLADAESRGSKSKNLDLGWTCNSAICSYDLSTGSRAAAYFSSNDVAFKYQRVVQVFTANSFKTECKRGVIIVTRLQVPAKCTKEALVIDAHKLRTTGNLAITFDVDGQGMSMVPSLASSNRLWSTSLPERKL